MNAVSDATFAISVFAVDPPALGGVCLRSAAQPTRQQWLSLLRELLPAGEPLRRVSSNIDDNRLLGGLDLVATLKANRAISERGVLAAADGGVLVISMAERLSLHTAACINAALDEGEIAVDREGVSLKFKAKLGIVALDEGIADDECLPYSLLDRLALILDFNAFHSRYPLQALHSAEQILAARELLPRVTLPPALLDALCATALALGAGSVRISLLAGRVARISAALDDRVEVTEEDVSTAARLVLAPRATMSPGAESESESETETESESETQKADDSVADAEPNPPSRNEPSNDMTEDLSDKVLAAAQAAIPPGLLASLMSPVERTTLKSRSRGRVGAERGAVGRGRPAGLRQGTPKSGARLNVPATLGAAALWQRLRGRAGTGERLRIEASDFRVTRYKQRARTLTIFAVDASGSAAMNRLAEAKGAVELLLADCYIRRDLVSVIAFRSRTAEVLLPPTRSLVRAKRSLSGMAGGGGTPMAAALEAAGALAQQSKRRGESAVIVILSDGRANVARNGEPGHALAHRDALRAANSLRSLQIAVLFVDTSPRPNLAAKELAAGMNAKYVPLPYVSAQALSNIVKDGARLAAS
jgi:magnesium chelatase subunit D